MSIHTNTLRTVGLARLAPYTYIPPATPGEIIFYHGSDSSQSLQ